MKLAGDLIVQEPSTRKLITFSHIFFQIKLMNEITLAYEFIYVQGYTAKQILSQPYK